MSMIREAAARAANAIAAALPAVPVLDHVPETIEGPCVYLELAEVARDAAGWAVEHLAVMVPAPGLAPEAAADAIGDLTDAVLRAVKGWAVLDLARVQPIAVRLGDGTTPGAQLNVRQIMCL